MSVYETSITNPKKQLEFYKDLSEQLEKDNQELKKQLEKKYEKAGTLTGELLYEENTKLIKQQKEFIEWLENKIKERDNDIKLLGNDCYTSKYGYKESLSKYKEIIRGRNGN